MVTTKKCIFFVYLLFCCNSIFAQTQEYSIINATKDEYLERVNFLLKNVDGIQNYRVSLIVNVDGKNYMIVTTLYELHYYFFKEYTSFQSKESCKKLLSTVINDTIFDKYYLQHKFGEQIDGQFYKRIKKLSTKKLLKKFISSGKIKRRYQYNPTVLFALNRKFIELEVDDLSGEIIPRLNTAK